MSDAKTKTDGQEPAGTSSNIVEPKDAQARPQSAERLTADLAAMTRLHAIASGFVREGDLPALLRQVVAAAIATVGADMATLEAVQGLSDDLKLAAHYGLEQPFLDDFAKQTTNKTGSQALLGRDDRVIIEDINASPVFAGGAALDVMMTAGVHAIQSIALRDRSGKVLGILSTYHRAPNRPDDRDLELLDLLAAQCAEALERARWAEECVQQNARARLAEKLHESEARFRNTVENIPLNLVLYDREYRVLYLNPALAAICARICDVPPEALTDKRGAEIWPAAIWKPLCAHTERAVETRERQTYELDMTLPGQSRVVRQWTVVPLIGHDGEVNEILAMSHDITAQRRLVDELREADRRKGEFIAVLSHELRNPLAAIQSSLYVLERAAPGSEPTSHAKAIIDRQVAQLVRIVDDLLDVTRITQNKIRLKRERLDVNELVSLTIADNRSHLDRGGVGLEVRSQLLPVYVDADRARLAQVVTNLLSNAAKFTPAGGAATVSVLADAARDQAVISVSDTGAGIEPALLERLFQPFAQADRTLDLSRGGLGLGLALVKGLVELHDGEVSARSEGRGRGTEITVRLPLAADTSTEAAAVIRDDIIVMRRRVLLVEDEPDIASGLFQALSLDGHEVQIARNGAEALAKVIPFKPDVVFCDIGLPGMNGYEIARRLRANQALGSTLLVALSGYAQPEDVEKARDAGFDEHVPKPASMHRIRQILAAHATTTRQNGDPPTDPQ